MSAVEVERLVWTIALLVVIATFAYLTLGLGPTARRVPEVIVVPTLGLLAIQLVLDLRSLGWRRAGVEISLNKGVDLPAKHHGASPREAEVRRGPEPKRHPEILMLAWLLLLPVLIVGFGELVAMPAYTLVYLRVRARQSWLFSLGMAAVMGGVAFLVIRVLLSVPPYQGLFYPFFGGGW